MEAPIATTPCKGCGKPMIYAKSPKTGKMIPLDARAPVFFVVDGVAFPASDGYYVSHFSTCVKADQFSARNKKRASPGEKNP